MKRSPISNAEWQVMEVIWKQYPITGGEIAKRLEGKADWHPRTVKTLVSRLVRKGVVALRKDGHRYLCSPKLQREQCVRDESESFLRRFFGGAAAPALVHFVEQADLTSDEIDELREILDKKQRKKGGHK